MKHFVLYPAFMFILFAWLCIPAGCERNGAPPAAAVREQTEPEQTEPRSEPAPQPPRPAKRKRTLKVAHVFVPLCDNRHQGIVKVPAALGNGQDPKGNLYWGAMYGADTFFARSPHWRRANDVKPPEVNGALAWSVFANKEGEFGLMVAMCAYDGRRMKEALVDFLNAAAGDNVREIAFSLDGKECSVQIGGCADLVCFTGHNGLMDVRLDTYPRRAGGVSPEGAVVLACRSYDWFAPALREAGCEPLITTSNFMAPEAYTLDAIIRSWAAANSPARTRDDAAAAYAKYQKCSLVAAKRLFVAGWAEER